LPFSYYEELLAGFKRIKPDVVLKCFTAVEIHFFARHYGMTYVEVLERLRRAGLDSLPGGGAEIFHPEVRQRIASDKATADEYLEVHRVAHRLGMRTNATMLYGHVETFEHRVDHLLRLRSLQDETGGLLAFIPLAFHPDGNGMKNLPAPTAIDALRTIAVSRLLLDNVAHVKAYWVSMTPEVAQIALRFGADDIDGTIVHETIYRAAGSRSPRGLTVAELVRLIQEAGRVPVERDTLYQVVREHPRAWVSEAALKVRERKANKHLEVL
jgi:aminodeoxyfutalosine synthase